MSLEGELLELVQIANREGLFDGMGFLQQAYSDMQERLDEKAVEKAVDVFLETPGYYGNRVRAAIKTYLELTTN